LIYAYIRLFKVTLVATVAIGSGKPPIQATPIALNQEVALNIYIYLFLLFGAVFGLATFSYRHIFSEGPHKVDTPEEGSTLGSRLLWALVCTFLWPIMALTGLNSVRILAKRKRQAAATNL
jgi:lysylphosphatidylglycerol synthetase-like protein (DUF2156 family)